MNAPILSNALADMAERVKDATAQSADAEKAAIERALEAGRLLLEAKSECRHGQWLLFLERAGVPERKAQRFMKLARSGLKSDTVSDLGGVRAALAYLAEPTLPGPDEHIEVYVAGADVATAWVWPSVEHPGFYNVGGFDGPLSDYSQGCAAFYLKRPISGHPLTVDGEHFNPVWRYLRSELRGQTLRFETRANLPGDTIQDLFRNWGGAS